MRNATDAHTPLDQPAAPEDALVLSRREGPITRITLNRPRAINALNLEMFEALDVAVRRARSDGSTAILIDGAGERGFCGGGDIKQISSERGREILAIEYRVDHALATAAIPVVGFMDGITMGGGIGLTGHASHRVVTERSRLAMPEVRIGIAPDVGGNLLLARAPRMLGDFLAATAGEFAAGDAIALGFADYFVPSDRLPALAEALAAGESPDTACERFSEPAPDAPLLATADWWEPIARATLPGASIDPRGAALRLLAALDAAGTPESLDIAATVRSACPMSVAAALAGVDRTRALGLGLAEVLADDLRVVGRLAARPDFTEGVRAQIIDKDRSPRWSPASLDALEDAELAAVFALELRPDEAPLVL